ncbi:MAG: L-aspartate oxidase [bacterium]
MKHVDVIIIGAGISGLCAALTLADAKFNIAVICKNDLNKTATSWAQGGMAISTKNKDEINLHIQDTLNVGRNLCDEKQVQLMISESPSALEFLRDINVQLDTSEKNNLTLALEAGHSKARIIHYKDKTGASIKEALDKNFSKKPNITLYDHYQVTNLCINNNQCQGIIASHTKSHSRLQLSANHTILATGGYSQLYKYSSTPSDLQGDGIYLAYQAGAILENLEFTQFHPTVYLETEEDKPFLISEVIRGAGGIIRNRQGKQFLKNYTLQEELGPRDVLSRAIAIESKHNGPIVLDTRHLKNLEKRFPNFYKNAKKHGYTLEKDLLPIHPAAHYSIGGIKTDTHANTNIKNLYAIGECASTRVHGANRLASNSLLEGIVFAKQASEHIIKNNHSPINPSLRSAKTRHTHTDQADIIKEIKNLNWTYNGLFKDKKSLSTLQNKLDTFPNSIHTSFNTKVYLELSKLICESALIRQESRGTHYRSDYPEINNAYLGYIQQKKNKKTWLNKRLT